MTRSGFSTPILLLVFNRPDYFERTISLLRPLQPKYLYISADGPRTGNEFDQQACRQIRHLVQTIDWPCRVRTVLRKKNLGCKVGVSSGISWFFRHVSEGIILEDDCVPDRSFFRFCAVLGCFK